MKHLPKYIVAIVIALAAVNLPAPIHGQTTIAIRGGLSRATLSGVESVDESALKARTGLAIGASATIPMHDKLSLRLDGGYVQKGYGGKSEGIELNLYLDYIELSGLGVVNFAPPESPASVYAFAGPSLAFNTRCEDSSSFSLGGIDESLSESCGDDTRSIDLGITGGVGAVMAVSEKMSLSVDLRYTLGLLSIDKTGDEDIKNRDLILQVGVGFPIGQ